MFDESVTVYELYSVKGGTVNKAFIKINKYKVEVSKFEKAIELFIERMGKGKVEVEYSYLLQQELGAELYLCDQSQFDELQALGEIINNVYKALIMFQYGLYEAFYQIDEVDEVKIKELLKLGYVQTEFGLLKL